MNSNDTTPVDPRVLAALVAEDSMLARGLDDATPPVGTAPGDDDPSTLEEIEALVGCLRLLEQAWPRTDQDPDGDGRDANRRVGRFELLGELGRGGFGVVYKAHDPNLGRLVALKVPQSTALLNPALEQRFLREARAAGGLDHPNIAPVFEAGHAGPLAYIASALCDGPNLSSWLHRRDGPAPPRLAAAIVARLADAVQHAHDRGILHRDLKPSNVLLWPEPAGSSAGGGGGPAAGGDGLGFVPRLTDFGLARILEEAGDETRTGVPIGSPPYMAPEQALGRNREVGPAADVYGLGAILFELLTGRPPFRGASNAETIRMVIDAEAVAPRSLRPGVPRDLETICLACLEKEPRRRYESAADLALDLRRALDGRPVRARRASAAERAWRSARRHPWRAAALGLLAAAVVGAVVGVSAYNARLAAHNARLLAERDRADRNAALADRNAAEADAHRRLAERHLHASRLREARSAIDLGQVERAQELLEGPTGEAAGADFAGRYLRRLARRDVELLRGHDRPINALAVGPGDRLVSQDHAGRVILRDLGPRPRIAGPQPAAPDVRSAFLALGAGLLAALEQPDPGGPPWPLPRLALYDAGTGRRVAGFEAGDRAGFPSAWSLLRGRRLLLGRAELSGGRWVLGGRLLALDGGEADPLREVADLGPVDRLGAASDADHFFSVAGGRLRRHDAGSGDVRHEVALDLDGRAVDRLDAGPDGRTVLLGLHDGPALLIDAETGAVLREIPTRGAIWQVVFATTGEAVATVERDGRAQLWDRPGGRGRLRLIVDPDAHPAPREATVAFSPDGRLMALGDWGTPGGFARPEVREVATGRVVATYPGRPTLAGPLAFAADGRSVLLASGVDVARWHLDRPPDPPGPAGHLDEAWSAAFSPDGLVLATGADDSDDPRTLRLWEVATGRERLGWMAHESTVSALAFSPDGALLASASLGVSGNLRLWEAAAGRLVAELGGHVGKVRSVAFSPDGALLLSAGDDGTVRLWEVARGGPLAVLDGHGGAIVRAATFLDGGRAVASAGTDRTVRFWEVATGLESRSIRLAREPLALAVSPDGATLAVADNVGHLELFDARTGAPTRTIRDADGELRAVAFTPDGSALAVAGTSRTVRLWDPVTGQELLALDGHAAQVNGLAFAPGGSALASCSHDGAVRLWWAGAPPASP